MSAYDNAVKDARLYLENGVQFDADSLVLRNRGLTVKEAELAIAQAKAEIMSRKAATVSAPVAPALPVHPTVSTNNGSDPLVVRSAPAAPASDIPEQVPQPNQVGEFATPLDGALFMASFGIPQTPLRGKAPFLSQWQKKATTDPEQLRAWYKEFNCNFGSVAIPGGFFIFEADSRPSGAPSVRERFEKQGGKFTSRLMIASRPDGSRGHRYYRWVEGLENIGQNATLYGDFSVRADAEQCVSPGSLHPETGKQYRVVSAGAPAPPTAEELEFWNSEKKVESKRETELADQAPIPKGQRNTTLTSIAGALRAKGLNEEEIDNHLQRVNRERCNPSLPEEEVRRIAHSIGSKPYQPDVFAEDMAARAAGARRAQEQAAIAEPEIDQSESAPYPVFPRWVIGGTSIGDGLVKPVVESSDKYPELVFMPAVVMFLNSIAGKVHIKYKPFMPSIFLGIIGPYGSFYKSTCCEIAQNYFIDMGLATHYNPGLKGADGKTVIMSPGSTEGFGIEMQRLNAKNALIYFDELGVFISKANIETSSFTDNMLSFYESRKFSNTIKARKESFAFEAQSYCFSWMWCTTDRKFAGLWAKLPSDSSGLNDRMFFLLTPQEPKKAGLYTQPNVYSGMQKTRARVEAAIAKGQYEYDFFSFIDERVQGLEAREIALLERLVLYFSIDLGYDNLDMDAVERAYALVQYARQAKAYLAPVEAETQLGRLQKLIIRELRREGGKMKYRELYKNLDASGKGTDFWDKAVKGLTSAGIIQYKQAVKGKGPTQSPAMVYLLKQED
jgi:hypothetical protein